MTLITGDTKIHLARMQTLRAALRLEIKGLQRRGRSAYAIIKSEFGLKGNRAKVLAQFEELIKEKEKNCGVDN